MPIENLPYWPKTLLALHADTRAFTLYGMFMGWFNLLEVGLNGVLKSSLGVEDLSGTILTRNIAFEDKIRTLKSLVSLTLPTKEDMGKYHSLLNRAKSYGELRNIVAHTPFRPSEKTDGIEFFAFKATSKPEYLEMDWSVSDVLEHVEKMRNLDSELEELGKKISSRRIITQALMKIQTERSDATNSALGGLFGLGAKFIERDESQNLEDGE